MVDSDPWSIVSSAPNCAASPGFVVCSFVSAGVWVVTDVMSWLSRLSPFCAAVESVAVVDVLRSVAEVTVALPPKVADSKAAFVLD